MASPSSERAANETLSTAKQMPTTVQAATAERRAAWSSAVA